MGDLKEEWRTIPGWEHYQVSNLGAVYNTRTQRALEPTEVFGSYNVQLHELLPSGVRRRKVFPLHRLVATIFDVPKPEGTKFVLHRDRNRANNRVDNLFWSARFKGVWDSE